MIQKLLTKDPAQRINVDQALKHPWIAQRESVASRVHRQMTIDQLKRFNARRKLKVRIIFLNAKKKIFKSKR